MKRIINLFCLVLIITVSGCGHYVAMQPSPPVVVVPPSPGLQYIWVNGAWRWNRMARSYQWSNGYWAARGGHGIWIDGHWASTYHGWKYVPGHWR